MARRAVVATRTDVYLECGKKRIFAGALDWPGWCRQGRNETEALGALLAYGPKYASILAGTGLGFVAPKDGNRLVVVERLRGTATTDFGAPGVAPGGAQERSCDVADLERFEKVLHAGWRTVDAAVKTARGKKLATGPRGGRRTVAPTIDHVIDADAAYLTGVGWKAPKAARPAERLAATREAILTALGVSAAGKIAPKGPRGGKRWTARYFVRRVAWHVMAHAWEIERRLVAGRVNP